MKYIDKKIIKKNPLLKHLLGARSKHKIKGLIYGLGFASLMFSSFSVSAQPFSCSADADAYMFQIPDPWTSMLSEVSTLNLVTGDFTAGSIQLNKHINGQGYNVKDNYIWGYNVTWNNGTISRVDKQGNIVNHHIAGLPAGRFLAGDMDNNGHLYLYKNGLTRFQVIDLDPASANYLQLIRSVNIAPVAVGDWAFNPVDGKIYGITVFDSHSLVRIDPVTGVTENLGLTGLTYGGVVGANYFDSNGFMYAYHNLNGRIYRLDISDPANINSTAIYFSQGPVVEFNDGARCSLVPVLVDFGDAPDTYGTTLASNGPRHTFKTTSTLYLGSSLPDTETDAQITTGAAGDDSNNSDDEDAFVTLPSIDPTSSTYSLSVTCSGSGTVAGWIDFNRSGTFSVGERSTAACNSGAAALNWTGLAGLTDGETYARFRIASDASEVVSPQGSANDGEVEDYPVTIGNTCLAFTGELTEVALPVSAQLKTADKIFVPSRSATTEDGHLRAYPVESSGLASITATWDAADLMNGRASKLFSTNTSGDKVLFSALDSSAFSSANVSTIKTATIGAGLGRVSKGNSLDILSNKINTSRYLNDTEYRSYYTNTVAARNQRVIMSSDDGFLYAFDYATGELVWGWMPRSIVSDLANPANFQSRHLMAGSVNILDLPDSSGNYATYIVGSYKSGLGHYVLKLNASGNISEIVWDDDQSATFIESPNNGEMEFFRDGSGMVYASFALVNSSLTSELMIKSLVDSSEDMNIALSYQVSSTPFVMPDFDKGNAPTKKTIYIGSTVGDIYATKVLDINDNLLSEASIQAWLESSNVAAMDNADTDAVLYINASVSTKNNKYYLSTQTATQLTVHRYKSSDSTWKKAWKSSLAGGGRWTSGAYNDVAAIQGLPSGATITDKVVIVGDAVILPVSVFDGSGAACYGEAYYYFYELSNGGFPTHSIVTTDDAAIVSNISLGFGEARRASVSNLAGTNKLMVYGIADKKTDLTSGIATTFVVKDLVSVGMRGWKEIGR